MSEPTSSPNSLADAADAARFRKRLTVLGAIALVGLAALTARLVWLQAF